MKKNKLFIVLKLVVVVVTLFIACEKSNNPPGTPLTPIGPSTWLINSDCSFSTLAYDPEDDSMVIRFYWGDGDTSDWSYIVASGDSVVSRHSWSAADTYYISAQARDLKGNVSDWSGSAQIFISSNHPPITPSSPNGPYQGITNVYYSFSSMASDPDGDSVSIQFSWGDGDTSAWSNFIPNNAFIAMSKTWHSPGTYMIKARAKDIEGSISSWSFSYSITINLGGGIYPNYVQTTIPVGTEPVGITTLPNGNFLYVANNNSSNVSVIRTSDNTVVATVPVGNGPWDINTDPNGNYIYVTNDISNTVSVIRTSDNTVITSIPIGNSPRGIAVTPNGNYVYVANLGSDNVSVIRASDNTVIAIIPIGTPPWELTILPNGDYIYVTNPYNNTVSVIRTSDNTIVTTISVTGTPYGITTIPSGDYVYLTNNANNTVTVIRTLDNTVIATVPVGYGPHGIASLPSGNYVYVTNMISNDISVIRTSTNSVVALIPSGNSPQGVVSHPDGEHVYVTNNISNNVSLIGR